ncbi:MAG: hypothetical protein ACI8XU_001931, partial [Kiritimatiellia bacterium]
PALFDFYPVKTITYVTDMMMFSAAKLTDMNVVDNHSHYHLKYQSH